MSARTWKCPDCEFTDRTITQEWIVEHGTPVWSHCDADMELQPEPVADDKLLAELLAVSQELLDWEERMGGWEAKCWGRLRQLVKQAAGSPVTEQRVDVEAEQAILLLIQKAEQGGVQSEDLDDMVHDLAAGVASAINNGGLAEQIRYLVAENSAPEIERQIDDLIGEKRPRPEAT